VPEVNRLMKQFADMSKMMRMMQGGGAKNLLGKLGQGFPPMR